MKAIKFSLFLLSTIMLFVTACEKDDNQAIGVGAYTGTFTVNYASGTHTVETTIVLKSPNEYTCTTRGSGTYSFGQEKVVFNDKNYWTADFDWGLILSGEYNYSYDGIHLRIWKVNDVAGYEYNLERVSKAEENL